MTNTSERTDSASARAHLETPSPSCHAHPSITKSIAAPPCSSNGSEPREALVEVELLGPVGLRANGQRVELGSDKERVLLASMVLAAGRPIALDTLIDRLWDDQPPPHARENLHTYASRIRRRLRRVDPSSTGAPHIVTRAHTYTLETARLSVDWHRYQHLVTQAGRLVTDEDHEQAAVLLGRAEQLWRGEALAGLPGLWAETVRRTLTERRLSATVSRIAALLRLGRFSEATAELTALVERHPGDETLAGQLMLAHYGNDRYTEALRVHQEVRQHLMTQFGSRPGIELKRIHSGILDRVPATDLVRGGGRPERTASTSRPTAGRTVHAPPQPPRNLPHQPPLVGRRTELQALSSAVDTAPEDGAVISLESVSTVSGMAGVGKTAVAVHSAQRLTERFPDAQLYLDLRGHSPVGGPLGADAALATLLRLLGAPAANIPLELESRSALWRTMLAERRAVIVLDDAVSAHQIRPLLPGGSRSLTIVTSRRHLTGLPHARHIPLDVLPDDDAVSLFCAFAGVERSHNVEEVTRIVRQCGGLPLAIELVASRFQAHPSWTLTTLADRLARPEGRLDEIRDADQDVVHVFDLMYRTLTAQDRTAFRRLSLHPGRDFTAEAATAMLGLRQTVTERTLESLLASHLLREPTPDRYQYHDLLREYGRSRAAVDDSEQVRSDTLRRLIDFYAVATDCADRVAYPRRTRPELPDDLPRSRTPYWSDADAGRSWLAAERINLLAVEAYARGHDQPETAARLAYAMTGFLSAECHWQDAHTVLRPAVDHWSHTGDSAALGRALSHLSALYAHTGRYPEATETGERALEIARTTEDVAAEEEALRTLGTLHWHLGENRTALVLFQKSFSLTTLSGDPWERARGHNNIAVTLLFLGEHDRAREHFEKALFGFTEADDQTARAKALNNLGDLHMRIGELDSARHAFEKSLFFLEQSGNRYDRATVRGSLADALTELGDTDSASALYQETLLEFTALGDQKSEADTLIGLGEACRKAGNTERAVSHLTDALDLAQRIGATHQETQAQRRLGQTCLTAGHLTSASHHLEAAVSLAERMHDMDETTQAQQLLAEVRLTSGDPTAARALLKQAFENTRTRDPREARAISARLADIGGDSRIVK
ncbi:DNA-binding SARP family transcriptional activator/tetratricopeptide (TPR) repeat protein [Streptomyces aurantiacus]|uniref:AfsR/SARP family transcriptional regulator n=1 Tax=Streptomyces aurantiacus TaxID=47760 RepID=UPI002791D824|nr:tetratricopeptide repeat protein [Streptomyces aurantiacus]MDQ0773553.1 DNA-binding SARP family transcriptional activator/tetratricopeptide (TPR) repeat protein [Streptomyces aurantiacus]